MDKLISREAAIKSIKLWRGMLSVEAAVAEISAIHAVDAAPVVHARWIWSPEYCKWICSACAGREGECEAPVCKWCGARMDLPEGKEARND